MRNRYLLFFLFLFISGILIPSMIGPFNEMNKFGMQISKTDFMFQPNNDFSGIDRLSPSNTEGSNTFTFWQSEKNRITEIPLNLTIVESEYIIFNGESINRSLIQYDSPSYIGTFEPIHISAWVLIAKENESAVGILPGVALFHGLHDNKSQLIEEGIRLSLQGMVVILSDHPGHGESTGPKPTPDNFYYTGQFNSSCHFYLTVLAGLQTINTLKSFVQVDPNRIGVTGFSYGGMTTLAIGSIYHDTVHALFPMGIAGDFETLEGYSMWYSLYNRSKNQLEDDWINNRVKFLDPYYYVESTPTYPAVTFYFGYFDEFFSPLGLNNTYTAVKGEKYMMLKHNGHHTLVNHLDTLLFFMKYKLQDGPAPTTIDSISFAIFQSQTIESLNVTFLLTESANVKNVSVYYRVSAPVSRWFQINTSISELDSTFNAIIDANAFSRNIQFFIQYREDTDGDIWFTSPLYMVFLENQMEVFYYISIAICMIMGVLLILSIKYQIYIRSIKDFNIEKSFRSTFLKANLVIFTCEVVMMVSAVIEPWITVNNSTYIPFLHIFNILPAYSDIFEFIRYDTGINAYIICIAMIFLTPIAPGLAGVIFFALGLFIMVGVPNYLNSLGFSGFAYVGPWGYVFLIACFLISLTELLLLINIKEIRRKMLEIKM